MIRSLAAYRLIETRFGESLQRLALRELGDAERWVDLVLLNGLQPPYLTADPGQVGPGVLAYGAVLVAPGAAASASIDPAALFGTDLSLINGRLDVDDGGDLLLVSGQANLRQALRARLLTRLAELVFHPLYGNGGASLIGSAAGPAAAALAASLSRASLKADPRVADAPSASASVIGDVIAVDVTVTPISGSPIDLSEAL